MQTVTQSTKTADARDRLIATAMQLMHDKGYTAVGINEICKEADVKRGSFFHYFPSKQDLALAVLDTQWQRTVSELLEPAFAPDLPALGRIKRMFQYCYHYQRTTRDQMGHMLGCPFGILAAELSTQDSVIRERVQEIFEGFASYFEAAVREAHTGESEARVDPEAVGKELIAYLEGALLVAKAHDDPSLFEKLTAAALRLAGDGSAAPA